MTLKQIRTLADKGDIDSGVIDCWASLLNKSEENKKPSTPSRMFFPTDMLTEMMLDEKTDEHERYAAFESMMKCALVDIGENIDLKKVELMLFPMVAGKQYYLMVFNFNKGWVDIMDRASRHRTIENRYGNRPRVLKLFVCRFMSIRGQKKANNIVGTELVQTKLVCHKRKVEGEDGVMLMRHMEAYMGEEPERWDCGLGCTPALFEARCKELRTKYLAKFMLSDYNTGKEVYMTEYDKFAKMDKFSRMKKVEEMMKKVNGKQSEV